MLNRRMKVVGLGTSSSERGLAAFAIIPAQCSENWEWGLNRESRMGLLSVLQKSFARKSAKNWTACGRVLSTPVISVELARLCTQPAPYTLLVLLQMDTKGGEIKCTLRFGFLQQSKLHSRPSLSKMRILRSLVGSRRTTPSSKPSSASRCHAVACLVAKLLDEITRSIKYQIR
jgi:hypothetical protein